LQRLTRTGTVLGTPLYMSPEQARGGDDVDHRADIWSAGLMLYECLTGEVSLSRQQLPGGDLAGAHAGNRVAVRSFGPSWAYRPQLTAVVMRALEKNRDKRYQQMAEFEHDLERLLAGDSTGRVAGRSRARANARPASPALPLAALGVLGAGAAIARGLFGRRR